MICASRERIALAPGLTMSATTIFLHSGSFHPGFSQGQAIIAYVPAVQVANFYWDGID